MTAEPEGSAGGASSESLGEVVVANEFSEVRVSVVRTRNGLRLRIRSLRTGQSIDLCPLELESLTGQSHELFTDLLARSGDEEGPTP